LALQLLEETYWKWDCQYNC